MRRISKVMLSSYISILAIVSLISLISAYGNIRKIETVENTDIKINLDDKKEKWAKNPDDSYMSPVLIDGTPYLTVEETERLIGLGVDLENKSISISPKKTRLLFAHFNKTEGEKMIDMFKEVYPKANIKFKLVPKENGEYEKYLTNAINKGDDIPDVFAIDSSFLNKFINTKDTCADLTEDARMFVEDMIPYTIDAGKDNEGVLRALSSQISPGVIAYKKAVAEKYLDTVDIIKIEEMFSTPEKMLETAKTLKEKSGGKVCLFSSFEDPLLMYLGDRTNGWVVDNRLVIDEKIMDFIEFAKTFRDNKYDAGLDKYSSDWFSTINNSEKVMAYICPSSYVQTITGYHKISESRWRLINSPWPFYKGGTWYGIYSKSQKKDIAWDFIEYFTSNKNVTKVFAQENNNLPNNFKAISEISKKEVSGLGINMLDVSRLKIKEINGNTATQYDEHINSEFIKAMKLYLDGKLANKEEMISLFKKNVKSVFHKLDVS